jgi:O-antigen/teichoic acid export membrane protein
VRIKFSFVSPQVLAGGFSAALRLVGLSFKLLLLVALTKFTQLEDVGIYGLVLGASVVFSHFAGLGVGINLNRRISVSKNIKFRRKIFQWQWKAFLLMYLAICVFSLLVYFFSDNWHLHILILILFICIAEHASSELTKLMLALHQQVLANVVLFCKTGAWIPFVIVAFLLSSKSRNIEFVLF